MKKFKYSLFALLVLALHAALPAVSLDDLNGVSFERGWWNKIDYFWDNANRNEKYYGYVQQDPYERGAYFYHDGNENVAAYSQWNYLINNQNKNIFSYEVRDTAGNHLGKIDGTIDYGYLFSSLDKMTLVSPSEETVAIGTVQMTWLMDKKSEFKRPDTDETVLELVGEDKDGHIGYSWTVKYFDQAYFESKGIISPEYFLLLFSMINDEYVIYGN